MGNTFFSRCQVFTHATAWERAAALFFAGGKPLESLRSGHRRAPFSGYPHPIGLATVQFLGHERFSMSLLRHDHQFRLADAG